MKDIERYSWLITPEKDVEGYWVKYSDAKTEINRLHGLLSTRDSEFGSLLEENMDLSAELGRYKKEKQDECNHEYAILESGSPAEVCVYCGYKI